MAQKPMPKIVCLRCNKIQVDSSQWRCIFCDMPLARGRPEQLNLALEYRLEQELLRRNEWPDEED